MARQVKIKLGGTFSRPEVAGIRVSGGKHPVQSRKKLEKLARGKNVSLGAKEKGSLFWLEKRSKRPQKPQKHQNRNGGGVQITLNRWKG